MVSRSTFKSGRGARRQTQRPAHLVIENLEDRRYMAGDMVLTWNEYLQDAIQRDATQANPGHGSRNPAIVQVAVYDAVNAIAQTHSSFLTEVKGPAWASKDAAVAVAAHDTLVALYPAQKAIIDGLLHDSLATIANGAAENAGIAIGRRVAAEVLALRTGDGSAAQGEYLEGDDPGEWSPDPTLPNVQKPFGVLWGEVKPWGITDPDVYLPPPPPDLDSQEYADAFNELVDYGGIDSTHRTDDQTEIGVFWAYDRQGMGPPTVLYNSNVAEIAVAKGNTLEENARLFALINVGMADAGIAIWNAKYEYNFWRPVTAIRGGDSDGNPNTDGIADWVPLGAPGGGVVQDFTPPFPAYTSGHAGFGAAVFEMLANFYGSDHYNYTLTSDETPGVTRDFTTFSQAAEENGKSRIYLGIHWEFDSQWGQWQGRQIADYLYDRFMVELDPGAAALGVQLDGGGFRTTVLEDGGSDISIYREGNRLEIADDDSGDVLANDRLDDIHSLRFSAQNGDDDFVTLDSARGGAFVLPGGMLYDAGADEGDGFWYNGTSGREVMKLRRDLLDVPGALIRLPNVSYVGLASFGAHDAFLVSGDQHGRVIDLLGDGGSDAYWLAATDAQVSVTDARGHDTLDFSLATHGVTVDLAKRYGQSQSIGGDNGLRIEGVIEDLVGSRYDDLLMGNHVANRILGLAGHDVLLGRLGNDDLQGGENNDILIGGVGDDSLAGGPGHDLLIGGPGRDRLLGEGGGDLQVGAETIYDDHVRALRALLAEWTAPRSLDERIANLRHGASNNRRNGFYFLDDEGLFRTIIADLARDQYLGAGSGDWVITDGAD